MLILPWHVGSCHARVTTSESEERTVTGVSETSTSIPTSNFPRQNGHFQNYFEAPLLPRELCHQSTHLVSPLRSLGAQPPAPKSIRFTTWKLRHHLYRSLHMLRFFIVVILASAHICMSHKNPILLITFLHGNEGRKLRRLSLAPNESNWSCEAFDVSCLHPIISTTRNVLLACMCEVVLWSFPNTRKCISCSNVTMMPGLGKTKELWGLERENSHPSYDQTWTCFTEKPWDTPGLLQPPRSRWRLGVLITQKKWLHAETLDGGCEWWKTPDLIGFPSWAPGANGSNSDEKNICFCFTCAASVLFFLPGDCADS